MRRKDHPAAQHRMDAGPLLAVVRRLGIVLPQQSGERHALVRAQKEGSMTVGAADAFAVRVLGMHPCEIWPDWLDLTDDDEQQKENA